MMQVVTHPGVTFQNEVLNIGAVLGLFQVRVRAQECSDTYQVLYAGQFPGGSAPQPVCHPAYSEEHHEHAPFGPGDSTCDFPGSNSTMHWTGGGDFGGDFRVHGRMLRTLYSFQHSYLFMIPTAALNESALKEAFDCLEEHGWVDQATRAILLRLTVFTNPDVFTRFQFLIEVWPR